MPPEVEWTDQYKLPESKKMTTFGLSIDSQDNVYSISRAYRIHNNETLAVIRKLNAHGVVIAEKAISPGGDKTTHISNGTLDSDENLIITGRIATLKKGFVVKFDKNLNILWEATWQDGSTVFHSVVTSPKDNAVYVTGAVKVNRLTGYMVAVKFDGQTGRFIDRADINRPAYEGVHMQAYDSVLVNDKNGKEWLYASYPAPERHSEIMWWRTDGAVIDWTMEKWWSSTDDKNPVQLIDHPDGYIVIGHRYMDTKSALSKLAYDENGFTAKRFEKLYVTAHDSDFHALTTDESGRSIYLAAATPDGISKTNDEQNALIAKYHPDCKTEHLHACWVSRYNHSLQLNSNIDLRVLNWEILKSYSYETPSDVTVINDNVYMLVNSTSKIATLIDGKLSEMIKFDNTTGQIKSQIILNNNWSHHMIKSNASDNAVFVSGENPPNLESRDPDAYIHTRKVINL
ncbi:MAG: hypothetical protein AAGF06_03435 [Pseudomonadota bacterium]